MRMLLVTGLVVLGFAARPTARADGDAPMLDGKWLIVYAEEGGRRNNAWEQRVAIIKGDKLTYAAEEKERTMQLTFGPNQTVSARVSGDGKAKAHKGVCIASQDYLCISLVTDGGKAKNAAGGEGEAATEQRGAAAAQPDGGQRSSGDFILILRRQRTK